MGKIGY